MEEIRGSVGMDWEQAKDRLIYRLINKDRNKELLSDIPGISCGDMALVCSVLAEEQGREEMLLVSDTCMEQWGKTKAELFTQAIGNTPKLLPPMVGKLDSVLRLYLDRFSPDAVNKIPERNELPLYIVTNQKIYHGAAAIFYEGILDEIAGKTGADLFLLPSSVHEILAVPDDGTVDPCELEQTIHEVNKDFVQEKEILSERVYHYSRESGRIRPVWNNS